LARIEAHAVLNALLIVAPRGWSATECDVQFRSVDGVQVPSSFQRLVIAPS
jgi:hypothetical protein